MKEMHAIIHGLVQGVCFRATTQEHANALRLSGWVRNCEDGSVELLAQGTETNLKLLLERLRKNPGYGQIESMDVTYRPLTKALDGFHIIRGASPSSQ